jgi:hypothetical protein
MMATWREREGWAGEWIGDNWGIEMGLRLMVCFLRGGEAA